VTSPRRHAALAGALFLLAVAWLAAFPRPRPVTAEDTPAETAAELRARLDAAFADASLEDALVGALFVRLTDGAVLYEREADRALIPASNQKLVTTACALDRLGPDAELRTELLRAGPIVAGTLRGSLVVRGGGDPSPGARFDGEADGLCRRWARLAAERGIRRIEGDIVADDRLFDRQGVHPEWPRDQLDRWYSAPASALALNDACVDVSVSAGARAGAPAEVKIAPGCRLFEVDNQCKTTADKAAHSVNILRRPGTNRISVRGAILVGAAPVEASISVDQPALVFVACLRERLEEQGIEVAGEARLVRDAEKLAPAHPLAAHVSSVSQVLAVTNKRSQNHYAEQLFKLLGARAGGGGTYSGGARAASAFLEGLGAPAASFTVTDGSGLARGNRISPRTAVALLRRMEGHDRRDEWLASLALGGQDGTLRTRFKAPAVAGRVLAKTGTISGVSALSGYILDPATREPAVAFSVIMNGLRQGSARAREIQDAAVLAVAPHAAFPVDRPGRAR